MQLAIEFAVPVVVPKGQCHTLLLAFKRGEKLTVAEAMQRYNVYALSQRVGDLKRMGWPILSKPKTLASGKTVSEYWMED